VDVFYIFSRNEIHFFANLRKLIIYVNLHVKLRMV